MSVRSIILTIIALISFSEIATAQIIALGAKTPRFKKEIWLDGNRPIKSKFTYIEFIHSSSIPCRRSAERIYDITSTMENVRFVLISHQSASKIDSWVTKFIGSRSGVIVEDENIRASFGVQYAPYAVIIDSKRRALWFGNPNILDGRAIEKLLMKK